MHTSYQQTDTSIHKFTKETKIFERHVEKVHVLSIFRFREWWNAVSAIRMLEQRYKKNASFLTGCNARFGSSVASSRLRLFGNRALRLRRGRGRRRLGGFCSTRGLCGIRSLSLRRICRYRIGSIRGLRLRRFRRFGHGRYRRFCGIGSDVGVSPFGRISRLVAWIGRLVAWIGRLVAWIRRLIAWICRLVAWIRRLAGSARWAFTDVWFAALASSGVGRIRWLLSRFRFSI